MRCSSLIKAVVLTLIVFVVLNLGGLGRAYEGVKSSSGAVSAVNGSSSNCMNFESTEEIPEGFFRVESCRKWNLREKATEKIAQARKAASNKQSRQLLNQSLAEFQQGNYEQSIALAEKSIEKSEGGIMGTIGGLFTAFADFEVPFLPRIAGVPPLLLLAFLIVVIVTSALHLYHRQLTKSRAVTAPMETRREQEQQSSSFKKPLINMVKMLSGMLPKIKLKSGNQLDKELQGLTRDLNIFISKKETRGDYTDRGRERLEDCSRLIQAVDKEIKSGNYDRAQEKLNQLAGQLRRLID